MMISRLSQPSKNYITRGNHVLINIAMLLFLQLTEFKGKCNADPQTIPITNQPFNIVQFFPFTHK